MARRDGTGPMGIGPKTGRGLGSCIGGNALKYGTGLAMGLGFACRCGFGRGFAVDQTSSKTQKELLHKQKELLQNRLEVIDKQLGNL
ncbi:DUF5320 domain-containing protein [Alkalibaculum bacchi]|uniref:DUF5320 domain-containing protein n=1 Tax=Alkalibaculum bacchi TaxID=645887 RepID=UPI0026ED10C4|nr:DUF5320 domain-containing protein [Alkalibaculum bacchi]